MRTTPDTECKKCGRQVGPTDYLLAMDGITNKIVAFHTWCNPNDPDLQRHHNVTLKPALLGFKPKEF